MKAYATKYLFILISIIIFIASCKEETPIIDPPEPDPMDTIEPMDTTDILPSGTTFIPPSDQRDGDAAAGYAYLTAGNYVSSGIPHDIFTAVFPANTENVLGRDGVNANLDPEYTASTHPNGTLVVAPNCMQCHGGSINGQYIVGLGNINYDFTTNQGDITSAVDAVMGLTYPPGTPEHDAYVNFSRAGTAIGPYIQTEVVGVNPADQIAAALAAFRDNLTLEWLEEPALAIPDPVIPADIPPWWVLKKKNASLYTGAGRGDYARIFMATSILTLEDANEAATIDSNFGDVLAYIKSIEAPAYPFAIDNELATQGESIFNSRCSSCHGTYGADETYPNLLVDLDVIGTDPLLANSFDGLNEYVEWYNTSWFNQGNNPGYLEGGTGYMAQPLDGIWASAPYLHNGSIPTLQALLKSDDRPTFWRRNPDVEEYDQDNVGWMFSIESSQTDKFTYDTTKDGYGNEGHTFGDSLSDEERESLIEYMKTL